MKLFRDFDNQDTPDSLSFQITISLNTGIGFLLLNAEAIFPGYVESEIGESVRYWVSCRQRQVN